MSEVFKPITISDIIPGARERILGLTAIELDNKSRPIEKDRFRDKAPVLTYEPLEAKIAKRSLWNHIGITYMGVLKKASEDKALEVVNDTLYQVAEYPTRSFNVIESLSGFRGVDLPNMDEIEEMRSHHAPTIEIGRFLGATAIRQGQPIKPDSIQLYYQARDLDNEEFPVYLSDTIMSHQYRIKFWNHEFQSIAEHPAINQLFYRIKNS